MKPFIMQSISVTYLSRKRSAPEVHHQWRCDTSWPTSQSSKLATR